MVFESLLTSLVDFLQLEYSVEKPLNREPDLEKLVSRLENAIFLIQAPEYRSLIYHDIFIASSQRMALDTTGTMDPFHILTPPLIVFPFTAS